MDITVYPRKLKGTVKAIPSKSQAHRLLICSAFGHKPVTLICRDTNRDIAATAACLNALGAHITRTEQGYRIEPIKALPKTAVLPCGESGSTLRFMLPVAASLGVDSTFILEGRLPQRPLSPLWEELERMGCVMTRPQSHTVRCQGKLKSGEYFIDGSISSQFITGLMFALSLLPGSNQLNITGSVESRPYIDMTLQAFKMFGIDAENCCFFDEKFHSPEQITVEGDWSNAAFFLAAQALGNEVSVTGLQADSPQGDKAVTEILSQLDSHITVDGRDIPDLIPILAVTAGAKHGASFQNIGRLRLKESDRITAVAQLLQALGARTDTSADSLQVYPAAYHGGIIDSHNDHRIAMAAAIAATVSAAPVTILGAECVEKSYPSFWPEYIRLGGYYEQYIR